MIKLKPIARCLALTAIAGAFLPAFADNLFDADATTTTTTSVTGKVLSDLAVTCPAGADTFYVHQRAGCFATATFTDKSTLLLNTSQTDSVATLAKGLVWSSDNTAVTLPGTCATTGCFNPVPVVDKSVTADGSVKISATLTIDGITKTASTSVKLFAPIALKLSCPSTVASGGTVQIRFEPPQDDTHCNGSTYFSDGAKGDVTPFLQWSASDTALASVTSPSDVLLLPAVAPSPLIASYKAGTIKAATVTTDSNVTINAAGGGLTGSAALKITAASTQPTPTPTPVRLLISCPPVLRAGNMDRCYAGIRITENIAKLVSVKWASSDSSVVSIDSDGKVTAGAVTANSKATITATYTSPDSTTPQTTTATTTSATVTAGTTGATVSTGTSSTATSTTSTPTTTSSTATASTSIQVIPAATLSALIVNCTSTITAGGTGNCRAGASYSDDDKKTVTPTWTSSDTSVATIDASGKVTAKNVTSKSTVTITGSYTDGGVTKTATDTITINPASSTPPSGGVTPLSSATIECFFAWAETQYPQLFPTSGSAVSTVSFGPYSFRSYSINKTYLGIETLTNTVIYVGPFSGGTLLRLGTFSSVWAQPSGCK